MIDYSKENLKKMAKETGYLKNSIEKVLRLSEILEDLYVSEWKDKLVLKGGTAINMLYRGIPRLSVDIDLDYIGREREMMIQDKEKFTNYLKSGFYNKYELKDKSRYSYAINAYELRYQNNAGNLDNIKIDVNFIDRTHVLPIRKKKINLFGYQSETEINCLDECELYGSKLAALTSRCKPRDIFDVAEFLKTKDVDLNMLRKCLVFYNAISGKADILDYDTKALKNTTKRDYDRMLKPLLPSKDKFNNEEAVEDITNFLKNLLVFTVGEKQFITNFKEKKYTPELLFENVGILSRVSWHPLAYWKCGITSNDDEEAKRVATLMEGRGEDTLNFIDREVYEKIKSSKKGERFEKLYNGYFVYADRSTNEQALMQLIVFETQDIEQIQRIFKSSGFYNNQTTEQLNTIYENAKQVVDSVRKTINANTLQQPIKNNNNYNDR